MKDYLICTLYSALCTLHSVLKIKTLHSVLSSSAEGVVLAILKRGE